MTDEDHIVRFLRRECKRTQPNDYMRVALKEHLEMKAEVDRLRAREKQLVEGVDAALHEPTWTLCKRVLLELRAGPRRKRIREHAEWFEQKPAKKKVHRGK